jgi:hypothetical protein
MWVCLFAAVVGLVGASFVSTGGALVGLVGLLVGISCGIMTSSSPPPSPFV